MTQKTRGRPRSFDQEAAISSAMHVFWAKGYDGASMKDLTSAMNINSPSLYAAFGDKEALYHTCIDAYIDNDACAPLVAFETERDIRKAVHAFFAATIAYATDQPSDARGCFLSCSVAVNATVSAEVRDRLARAISETDARLSQRFASEVAAGALPADFPSTARARLMFDLRQGIVFRARAGADHKDLVQGIDAHTDAVLAPARG